LIADMYVIALLAAHETHERFVVLARQGRLPSTNSLFNANALDSKTQFNGVGRLLTYMSPTPNADVSALGYGGEAQC
jgi:hypothetical protein